MRTVTLQIPSTAYELLEQLSKDASQGQPNVLPLEVWLLGRILDTAIAATLSARADVIKGDVDLEVVRRIEDERREIRAALYEDEPQES